ncbi:MAG: hypothetical protein R6X16_01825 [Anaerolineae bacterium]
MITAARGRLIAGGLVALCGAVFAGALAYAVYAHFAVRVLPIDDGYIHLRYVRNILTGVGPVYNAGQRVMGSSSPLYVVWLTLLAWVTRASDLPALAVRSNALWYVGTMVCLAGVLRRMAGSWPVALLLAAGATLFSPMLSVSTGVMESYLWGTLVLGALWAEASRRARLAAALVGLAAVARPEGLLLLGLWGLRWLVPPAKRAHVRQAAPSRSAAPVDVVPVKRIWWRTGLWGRSPATLALALAPLVVWIAVSTPYYGSPIPHSVISKASGLYLMPEGYVRRTLGELFRAWSGGGALGWNPPASTAASGGLISLAQTLLPWIAIVGVVAFRTSRREGAWAPVALLVLLALFYMAGGTHLLEWYLPLIWVLWYPALFGGAAALVRAAAEHLRQGDGAGWWAAVILPAALLATVFVSGPARAAVELVRTPDVATIVSDDPVRMRVLAYHAAAEWLNAQAPEGARLGASEVGALGWTYTGYVIDSCALVSAEALQYIPVPMSQRNYGGDGVIGKELVQDLQPEYVASMPTFAAKSIMIDPWFSAHYKQAATFRLPQELWGSTHVLVWERIDPPVER